MKVLEDLEALYPGVYRHENVLISATHNHSAAGGFLQVATQNLINLINKNNNYIDLNVAAGRRLV